MDNNLEELQLERAKDLAQKFLINHFNDYINTDNEKLLYTDEVKQSIVNDIGKKYGCLIGENAVNLYYPTLKQAIAENNDQKVKNEQLALENRQTEINNILNGIGTFFKVIYTIADKILKVFLFIFVAIPAFFSLLGDKDKRRR